jgi:Fe2+ or Zn2+ uptake regulation protein
MKLESRPTRSAEFALLKGAPLRLTLQRLAIVRALLTQDHPTVAQVYDAVRGQFPTFTKASDREEKD